MSEENETLRFLLRSGRNTITNILKVSEENETLRLLLNNGTNTNTNTLKVSEDLEISIKKRDKYQYK